MQKHTYEAAINYKSKKPLDGNDKAKINSKEYIMTFANSILYIARGGLIITIDDNEHRIRFSATDRSGFMLALDKVVEFARTLTLTLSDKIAASSDTTGENDEQTLNEKHCVVQLIRETYKEKFSTLVPADVQKIMDEFTVLDNLPEGECDNNPVAHHSWMLEKWYTLRGTQKAFVYTDFADDDEFFIGDPVSNNVPK
ncbi:MAG: hypothetical protein M3R00_06235 [Pseudomonadota bacterium]|nr:hypothetical protein [Pseudomonadota bacterium]